MKLKPKEKQLKPVPLRLKVPGELYHDLNEYAEYYAITYKEPIEHTDLALLMIEQFMMADSGFKAWRRGQDELEPKAVKANGGGERPSFSSVNAEHASHEQS